MADRFYGAALGAQGPKDITEQATTTAAVVELRINDTVYSNKLQVLMALEAIQDYLNATEGSVIG